MAAVCPYKWSLWSDRKVINTFFNIDYTIVLQESWCNNGANSGGILQPIIYSNSYTVGFGQADTILSEQKKPTHFSENPNKRQSNGNFDHKDVVDKTGF